MPATHQRSVSEVREYEALEKAVKGVLSGVPQHPDYRFNLQYGGRFDDHERTFVGFSTGKTLRRSDRTHMALKTAKAKLDSDGRFGSVIHYMRGAGDYVLIVQFGPTPILS